MLNAGYDQSIVTSYGSDLMKTLQPHFSYINSLIIVVVLVLVLIIGGL
jgi:hypothetical protein